AHVPDGGQLHVLVAGPGDVVERGREVNHTEQHRITAESHPVPPTRYTRVWHTVAARGFGRVAAGTARAGRALMCRAIQSITGVSRRPLPCAFGPRRHHTLQSHPLP